MMFFLNNKTYKTIISTLLYTISLQGRLRVFEKKVSAVVAEVINSEVRGGIYDIPGRGKKCLHSFDPKNLAEYPM
jgi:hypothetical protein